MPVSEHPIISVVGGGFSVRFVDIRKLPGLVIGINEASVRLPKVDHAVSMDRLWTEHRIASLKARKPRPCTWLRQSAVQNIPKDYIDGWVNVFECDHRSVRFSENQKALNGMNSGGCGLNLAYCLRPEELYLFGFDMCRHPDGNAYWHPPYEWASPKGGTSNTRYAEWAAEFNEIAIAFRAADIKVFNISKWSKIMCWPKLSPKQIGLAR